MSKNYYEILQVDPKAEQEVIEAAYRRLARKYHPDVNPGVDATKRMKELNEAYKILSDTEKRRAYDAWLNETQPGEKSYSQSYTKSVKRGRLSNTLWGVLRIVIGLSCGIFIGSVFTAILGLLYSLLVASGIELYGAINKSELRGTWIQTLDTALFVYGTLTGGTWGYLQFPRNWSKLKIVIGSGLLIFTLIWGIGYVYSAFNYYFKNYDAIIGVAAIFFWPLSLLFAPFIVLWQAAGASALVQLVLIVFAGLIGRRLILSRYNK